MSGMRSRALPVADAARRSIRSGRKNRASEQREDFFGHRKADGVGTGFAEERASHSALAKRRIEISRKWDRNPLPRFGGGEGKGADVPTAPYKHRLAHASGRRSRSERAFRCVGSRGAPERVLHLGTPTGRTTRWGKEERRSAGGLSIP